jgi:hypothetical protein
VVRGRGCCGSGRGEGEGSRHGRARHGTRQGSCWCEREETWLGWLYCDETGARHGNGYRALHVGWLVFESCLGIVVRVTFVRAVDYLSVGTEARVCFRTLPFSSRFATGRE